MQLYLWHALFAFDALTDSHNSTLLTGLQTTVGHRTMAEQNSPMSDEIATLVGHFVRPIFCCNI